MMSVSDYGQPGAGDWIWEDDAACAGMGTEEFFPSRGDGPDVVAAAKAVCATCPVRRECLTLAVTTHQNIGVWGGLSAKERRALKRGMQTMTPSERDETIRVASLRVIGAAKRQQAG